MMGSSGSRRFSLLVAATFWATLPACAERDEMGATADTLAG